MFRFFLLFSTLALSSFVTAQCDLSTLQIITQQDDFCGSGDAILTTNLVADTSLTTLQTETSSPDFQQNFAFDLPSANNGCVYALRISGSYTVWGDIPDYLDARYRFDPSDNSPLEQQAPNGLTLPPPDSIAPAGYNPQHEYLFYYTGDGTTRTVEFEDNAPSDNAGQMTFEWLAVPCITYAWTLNDNPVGTLSTLNVPLPTPANYLAELTVTDNFNDCALTQSQLLTVYDEPSVQVTTDNACAGQLDGAAFATGTNGTTPYFFTWSDGATGAQRTTLPAGAGSVLLVDANGCLDTVSYLIEAFPPLAPILELQDESCAGQRDGRITLMNNPGDWSLRLDGQALFSDTVFFLPPGPHLLSIEDANGCTLDSLIEIGAGVPLLVATDSVLNIRAGELLTLVPPVAAGATFVWTSTDSLDLSDPARATLRPTRDAVVQVTITPASGCAETFTYQILVREQLDFFVPDAFSPNGDGQNDVLQLFAGASVRRVLRFAIYDRWGSQLLSSTDFEPHERVVWDGTVGGQPLDSGPYVWMCEVEYVDGSIQWKSNTVLILR